MEVMRDIRFKGKRIVEILSVGCSKYYSILSIYFESKIILESSIFFHVSTYSMRAKLDLYIYIYYFFTFKRTNADVEVLLNDIEKKTYCFNTLMMKSCK